ncbi:MAG TPA: mechanosensitive ion channel domain-containing protein, partial [Alphaproteobacteria bacterium]|nr:mechanosensitive ion channel domain-containing protein [Alphaproteobacteria bacterium]
MEHVTHIVVPALLAAVALGGFGYYETIVPLAHDMALDLPGVRAGRLVLGTIGCLALAVLVSRLTRHVVTWAMARRGRQSPRLLHEMIAVLLFVAALVAIFALVFDRSLAGALATSGVLVAVLGFALRNTIADVVSGIALSIESPFRIGDWIETEAGVAGRVIEITWRATRVETRDQVHVVLPNSRIAAGRVTNYSAPRRHYRVQQTVVLDAGTPVFRAKQALLDGILAARKIRKSPAPDVR